MTPPTSARGPLYEVRKDGQLRAGPFPHNDAFQWILDHQSQSVDHATTHEGWEITMAAPERIAHITGHSGNRTIQEIRRFLPDNYTANEEVVQRDPTPYHQSVRIVIRGHDVAGWTLDGYVIPRLASGLIWAAEITE